MSKPLVSIIMGIYNCEEYLNEAIESIVSQTYTNWELIMCDDGSTDRTYEIATEYKNKLGKKITLLKNDKNMGLNYTLNKCLSKANGSYIARQDGDDISTKDRFEIEVEFLNNHPEYAMVSANMSYFDSKGEWGKSHQKENPQNIDFINGTPFCHAPCMVRKEVFLELGGYTVDDKLLRVEDYHLWVKMYSRGYKGYNIDKVLYKMRNDENAIKRRTWKNRFNELNVRRIAYKNLNIPFKYRYKIYIPIIKGLVPNFIYKLVYKKKYKTNI